MGFISFCDYTYQTMRDIPVLQMTRILFMFSCKLQNPHSGYAKYSPSRLSTTTAGNDNTGPTGHRSTLPPPPPCVPGVQTFIYPFEYFYSILTITSYNVILTYFIYRVYKNSWSYWVCFWLHSIYWCVMLVIIMLVSLLCSLPDPSCVHH